MTADIDRGRLFALYPALAEVPENLRAEVLRTAVVAEVPAGHELFAERHPCRGFPLVLAGSIKVVKSTASGREMLLYRVEPGGSCIITSSCILGQADYNARGVAETPLRLLLIPTPLFARLVAESAPFRNFVFHLFSERLAELMQLVEEVAFARLDRRLAKMLLARGGPRITVTHQQLAEELGSVREIVSRLLKGFADQGLVALGREQIDLVDPEGLRALLADS